MERTHMKMKLKPLVKEHVLDYLIDWNTRFWDGLSQRAIDSAIRNAPPPPTLPETHGLKILLKQHAQVGQAIRDLEAILKDIEKRNAARNEGMNDSIHKFRDKFIDLLKRNKGGEVVAKLKSMPNAPNDLVNAVKKLDGLSKEIQKTISTFKDK